MVYLYKIPTARIAAFCLISFLSVYLVNTVCLTNDVIISITEAHDVNHHHESTNSESHHGHGHNSSKKDDNCCSVPTFNYFSQVHALIPQFGIKEVTSHFISPLLHFQSVAAIFNKIANSRVEHFINGPPTLSTSGMSVRILIQSFII